MARLSLDMKAKKFYEDEIKGLKGPGQRVDPKTSRKRKSIVSAPPQSDTASHGGDDSEGPNEGHSDSGSEGQNSGSSGPSDMDGLLVASSLQSVRKKSKPKSKPATGLEEPEGPSKIGIAFSRILKDCRKADVMSGSKSVQKRKKEHEEEVAQMRAAKLYRKELRTRGHATVLPKGQDVEQDNRERALLSIATKGVVQLFNAMSKASSARKTAEVLGESSASAIKASKGALLQVLKPKHDQEEEPSWKALQKSFTGFDEALKMKDFDRKAATDGNGSESMADESVEDESDEDDS